MSQDPDGKRGKWIAVILEYDLEIKPTKLIKGQGLAQLMTKSNLQVLCNQLQKIEEMRYQRLRNKPLRWGNLQYIT